MKKLTLFFFAGMAFSCNSGTTSTDAAKDSASTGTPAATTNYPYTIEHPDNWEVGSATNTMTALKSLKAWEEGKMDESLSYFADSVHLKFDGLDKKMPKDSVKSLFTSSRNNYKTVQIKMNDWESVVSKDKSEEWVTLWYTQLWETAKGEKDSLAVIDDVKLKNGKVIGIDEYSRKLH